MPDTPEIPAAFRVRAASQVHWADWFVGLPRLLGELVADWNLRQDGATMAGDCAVVVPVRTDDGRSAVLKVSWPHWEAETEHLALRAWDGDAAVRLYRADPHRFALLLERIDAGRSLNALPVRQACEVIAAAYARLHRPALAQLKRLSDLCRDWHRRMPALEATGLVPRRLTTHATALLKAFAEEPDLDSTLLHTDLHFSNVLGAEREPWLVIDPKPIAGDPAYEVAPLLWNRTPEAMASGDFRRATLDKLYTVVDVAELDEDRVRNWAVVRLMLNVLWEYENSLRGAALNNSFITASTARMPE
jgi:streptomycin 6-kinase